MSVACDATNTSLLCREETEIQESTSMYIITLFAIFLPHLLSYLVIFYLFRLHSYWNTFSYIFKHFDRHNLNVNGTKMNLIQM